MMHAHPKSICPIGVVHSLSGQIQGSVRYHSTRTGDSSGSDGWDAESIDDLRHESYRPTI